jgi:nucleotide-binding universal stress UspA family protein
MELINQKPRNILVAVDGSAHAQAAAHLIRDLPLSKGSLITAMAVILPRNASDHATIEVILEQTKNILKRKHVEVDTKLVAGYPTEAIHQYSEENHPDLIVLGAQGLRATLGILLGGVAQQILEYASCPVLIVRAPYNGLKRVLLVTDGSIYSQLATEYLAEFTLPKKTKVELMHVLPPIPDPNLIAKSWPAGSEMMPVIPVGEMKAVNDDQIEEEEQFGKDLLEETRQKIMTQASLNEAPLTWQENLDTVLRWGDAASEIIHYIKENSIDMVVTGSRGLSPLQGMLLGSVSRKLVHYAGCSVLVVKGIPD